MNMNNKNTLAVGTIVVGHLGVTFLALKLLGIIHWSWFWVLCPIWGGIVIVLISIIQIISDAYKSSRNERKR